jgi:hypothetical protein
MNRFVSAFVVLAAVLPLTAQAQQRLSEERLIQLATERNTCGGRVVLGANYVENAANRVVVSCGEFAGGADAQGFVPVAGLGVVGAGAAAAGLVLVAASGGGSTPTTNGTN